MTPSDSPQAKPVALVTGVGRAIGIGAAIVDALLADGWDVVTVGWRGYDQRMPWGADTPQGAHDAPPLTPAALSLAHIEADLANPDSPASIFADANAHAGTITALVCCHCESIDSAILDTTVESFDRHFAVNARATWLLIKAFAGQFTPGHHGLGRIVAITSDHTAFNMPYGASKAAMDRIVLAAATELASLGITANVVNPGATDTGWMDSTVEAAVRANNLSSRIGMPSDCANLVRFLCSPQGQWINGQLLYSDGGLRS